jgi:nucleotide-binding universal stress UspA family protein
MYKKILVPLDGSKRAEAILPHVEQLARSQDSHVIFLRVLELGRVPLMIEAGGVDRWLEDMERMHEEAQSYINMWRGEFRSKGIKADVLIEQGPVVETIVDCAANQGADLIAIASHGRTGLGHVVYGSVAAGVLQRVDRPLLLIRS